ncbi:hypothetical protein O181_020786 [Austropuccinia psidii MF-1]|uniref:Amino acid permease/ SLC12A domain-containing protein n=1 Tax=Austropuccinia psidii MF-1 TaxID=1389203 RepID=A0A9Q3CE62_9BASI|nr:hypothetical protein [Austropuccinia psidii MF-1]
MNHDTDGRRADCRWWALGGSFGVFLAPNGSAIEADGRRASGWKLEWLLEAGLAEFDGPYRQHAGHRINCSASAPAHRSPSQCETERGTQPGDGGAWSTLGGSVRCLTPTGYQRRRGFGWEGSPCCLRSLYRPPTPLGARSSVANFVLRALPISLRPAVLRSSSSFESSQALQAPGCQTSFKLESLTACQHNMAGHWHDPGSTANNGDRAPDGSQSAKSFLPWPYANPRPTMMPHVPEAIHLSGSGHLASRTSPSGASQEAQTFDSHQQNRGSVSETVVTSRAPSVICVTSSIVPSTTRVGSVISGKAQKSATALKPPKKLHFSTNDSSAKPEFHDYATNFSSRVCFSDPPKEHCSAGDYPSRASNPNKSDPATQLALLGYEQEFLRKWDFWSLFWLAFCNISVLQGSFWALSLVLRTIGPILLVVGHAISGVFVLGLSFLWAEMASAFPVAGSIFTWVFKFARSNPYLRDWARLLSWIIGFSLFCAHVMLQLRMGYEFNLILTGIFTASGFEWDVTHNVQISLSILYVVTIGLICTSPLAHSPMFWKVVGIMCAIFHLCVCICLLATSSHQRTFKNLFHPYKGRPTFKSFGWTFITTWLSSTIFLGSETAPHLAEETKDASRNVPKAVVFASIFAFFMQIISNTCLGLTITPMRHKPATGWPVIHAVFWHCPKPVATFIITCLLFCSFAAGISQFLATTRFFWALARDEALPFGKFWKKVTPDGRPVRATLLFMALSVVICLMAYEKSERLMELNRELGATFVTICYMTTILLYLLSEKGVYDRDGRNVWNMRQYSKPIAVVVLLFLTLFFTTLCSPKPWPITTADLPWGVICLPVIITLSVMAWYLYGRSHYAGPVKSLTIWTVGHEVELPKKLKRPLLASEKKTTFQEARSVCQTVNERSAANLNTQADPTFDIPQTYCTYHTDGSLWTRTDIQESTIQESTLH